MNQLRVRTKKIIFLFPHQNICFGYSKEQSQDPKHYVKTNGLENIHNYMPKNFVYLNLYGSNKSFRDFPAFLEAMARGLEFRE